MNDLTTLELAAVELLETIDQRRHEYEKVNDQIKALMEMPTTIECIDSQISNAACKLINKILGESDLAEYYLFECRAMIEICGFGGAITCCKDSPDEGWPLRTKDDLISYLKHKKTCSGIQHDA